MFPESKNSKSFFDNFRSFEIKAAVHRGSGLFFARG